MENYKNIFHFFHSRGPDSTDRSPLRQGSWDPCLRHALSSQWEETKKESAGFVPRQGGGEVPHCAGLHVGLCQVNDPQLSSELCKESEELIMRVRVVSGDNERRISKGQ